jgi:ABC-type dipeptide/oligopeptide/nickel transport system permease subunit
MSIVVPPLRRRPRPDARHVARTRSFRASPNYPWVEILPGLTMFCVALGLNLFADVIPDVLNPRRSNQSRA